MCPHVYVYHRSSTRPHLKTNSRHRTPFPHASYHLDSISSRCLSPTSSTSLSLECGRQCSLIFCEYYTPQVVMLYRSLIIGVSHFSPRLPTPFLTRTTSYRLVPTFGRDTIHCFTCNTSALKKLAARDWEDMLQVSMPVIDELLPTPCNTIIPRSTVHIVHLARLRQAPYPHKQYNRCIIC